MNGLRDEAINDIKKYSTIEDMVCIDFKDKYFDFISEIYPFDGKHKDIHVYKASKMINQYESNEICILFLDIPDSEKEFCERKHTYIYKNIEELKQYIRNKYKDRIKNYCFDNIFHMTDDEKEYVFTLKIVKEFLNREKIKIKEMR